MNIILLIYSILYRHTYKILHIKKKELSSNDLAKQFIPIVL